MTLPVEKIRKIYKELGAREVYTDLEARETNYTGILFGDPEGFIRYYKNGRLHREDGPAFISSTGKEIWYLDGRMHRTDGPAHITPNWAKSWCLNGLLHREGDLPAIEFDSGTKEWFKNGELHRENDLPAIDAGIADDGYEYKVWCINGKPHRRNGPAAIRHGREEYWIDGEEMTKEEYEKEMDKIYSAEDITDKKLTGKFRVTDQGHINWYINGVLHRENGPARIFPNGSEHWYKNGKLHRDNDLPAVIYKGTDSPYEAWYQNGEKSRIGNPAVVYQSGHKQYWIKGNQITENEYENYQWLTKQTAEIDNKGQGNTMSKPVGEMIKNDATTAAYRVAGKQMHKAVKVALGRVLENQGTKKSQIGALMTFFDTELGEAVIALLLGAGLTYAPGLKDNERVQVLAKEFRISGMATAGNFAADTLMGELLPSVMQTLKSLPDPGKNIRVRVMDDEQEVEHKLATKSTSSR